MGECSGRHKKDKRYDTYNKTIKYIIHITYKNFTRYKITRYKNIIKFKNVMESLSKKSLSKKKIYSRIKRVIKKLIRKSAALTKWLGYILFLLMIFLTIILSAKGLVINEIMFNPQGSDAGREWIEIYQDNYQDNIDLSQYKFVEGAISHNIYPYNNKSFEEFAIICNDCNMLLSEYPGLESRPIYRSSFSLSNTGEYIAIKLNNTILSEVDYSFFASNISEGYSAELYTYQYYNDSYGSYNNQYNNSWFQSGNISGTPGRRNSIIDILNVDPFLNHTWNSSLNISQNISMNETTDETLNESMNESTNSSMNINDTIDFNNTYNDTTYNETDIPDVLNPTNSSQHRKCNISTEVYIKNNNTISNSTTNNDIMVYDEESIKFYNKIFDNDKTLAKDITFSIEYWVEDLFGNILKDKVITQNLNEKSYTPKIEENDKVIIIKNRLIDIGCDMERSRIYSEKMVIVRKIQEIGINEPIECPKTKSASCSCSATSQKSSSTASSATSDSNLNKTSSNKTGSKNNTTKSVVNQTVTKEYVKGYNSSSTNLAENDMKTSNNMIASKNISTYSQKNAGSLNGNIINESPNQKNSLYSLIGIIFLIVAGIILSIMNIMKKRRAKHEIILNDKLQK